ncbi:MAG TPA: transposase [Opitutaceae bacterium]|nr:transposase [Opitutaceae bacterium]
MINRGNYRMDIFDSVGAAQAFETTVDEACGRFGWVVHAYVLMRNHFHFALETPEPNLVEGMHWLQSTFATRFNRYRQEAGHLFQGRYQSLLIEDDAALLRVVDYIHLNPVRAKIVPLEQVGIFRWSSLRRFQRGSGDRPKWLSAVRWMGALQLADDPEAWRPYAEHLAEVAAKTNPDHEGAELCRGWAIGTSGWRRALAKEHQHLALQRGVSAHEIQELKHARWADALETVLRQAGRDAESLKTSRKGVAWKREVAAELRRSVGAPHGWLAEHLHMGTANSVRAWLNERPQKNMHISA